MQDGDDDDFKLEAKKSSKRARPSTKSTAKRGTTRGGKAAKVAREQSHKAPEAAAVEETPMLDEDLFDFCEETPKATSQKKTRGTKASKVLEDAIQVEPPESSNPDACTSPLAEALANVHKNAVSLLLTPSLLRGVSHCVLVMPNHVHYWQHKFCSICTN